MSRTKRAYRRTVAFLLAAVLFAITVFSDMNQTTVYAADNKKNEINVSAGVIGSLASVGTDAVEEAGLNDIDLEISEQVFVGDGEEEETADPVQTELEAQWSDKVMANVEESMNVRGEASEEAAVVGQFYKGDLATVLSNDGTWTQITSGNVTGYVKNDYLVYGMDAYSLANQVCTTYATSLTGGLRVRQTPSEDAEVLKQLEEGEKIKVDTSAETVDGWVAVIYNDSTAYVSAQYVSVALNLGTALTSEEVAAKEAAKAAEEAKKKNAVSASVDEVTLLGALIQAEAGNGSYEGMVAVGAVVMNRVRSGAYPGSIQGVIYQGGQFPPATNGSVAAIINRGVKGACISAAQEALAGTDNTNGALCFRSAASGYPGTVIGANVFF